MLYVKNADKYKKIVELCAEHIALKGPSTALQLRDAIDDKPRHQQLTSVQLAGILRVYGQDMVYGEGSATALTHSRGGYSNIYYLVNK
jgi:hypothetical protein